MKMNFDTDSLGELITESSIDAIIVIGGGGDVNVWNRAAADFFMDHTYDKRGNYYLLSIKHNGDGFAGVDPDNIFDAIENSGDPQKKSSVETIAIANKVIQAHGRFYYWIRNPAIWWLSIAIFPSNSS